MAAGRDGPVRLVPRRGRANRREQSRMNLISVNYEGGMKFSIKIGKHELTVDHPESEGGTDAGPMAPELLAAALGACMAARIARYCKTKNLPHEGLSLDLVPELSEDGRRLARIAIDVNLPEGFPEDRKIAARRAAEGCVIHNTLHDPPELDIEL